MSTHAIDTYALPLRELVYGDVRSVNVVGCDGIVDALSVCTYFAGCEQAAFPGGVHVVACQIEQLDTEIKVLLAGRDKILGEGVLLIVSDAKFPVRYTVNFQPWLAKHAGLSIILASSSKAGESNAEVRIDITDASQRLGAQSIQLNYDEADSAD